MEVGDGGPGVDDGAAGARRADLEHFGVDGQLGGSHTDTRNANVIVGWVVGIGDDGRVFDARRHSCGHCSVAEVHWARRGRAGRQPVHHAVGESVPVE